MRISKEIASSCAGVVMYPMIGNDQASSFYIPAGYLVILYEDSGYNGHSIGPFGEGSSNLPVNFIDELSSVIVSQPQSQPQPRTQTSTQNCPTFYRNENQQGDSFQMCSSGDVPNQWNDQALSFYVPAGYSVQLYQDSSFSGLNLGSYTQGSYDIPINGQLSSVIVSPIQTPTQTNIQACPTFYRNQNQQGDSFQICSTGNVPDEWNDQALSFYVPAGYSVQLYQDSGFSGLNLGSYTQGSYNIPTNGQLISVKVSQDQPFVTVTPTVVSPVNITAQAKPDSQSSDNVPTNGQLSSVEISQDPPFVTINVVSPVNATIQAAPLAQSKPAARKCPTFYTDIDQGGASFKLCSSGDVPSSYDNQVSSFYVPPGYYVRLYPKRKYGGGNFGTYMQGSYNVPSNFNNQLSSVLMMKR